MASASRVLVLALASRAAVLGFMLLADWLFTDLDSSGRLAALLPCGAGDGSAVPAGSAAAKPPLGVWDTVYFMRVAKCGYETDKINAFFPAVPAVMRTLGGALAGLLARVGAAGLDPSYCYAAAALVLNVAAFCLAAICLHRLSLRVLSGGSRGAAARSSPVLTATPRRSARLSTTSGSASFSERRRRQPDDKPLSELQGGPPDDGQASQLVPVAVGDPQRIADLALLLFCMNPASVFYSAAYSEAVFAAATWAGLLLLPSHHWAGVAALTLAAAARSNGVLGVWFPLHKALAAAAARRRLSLRHAVRAVVSCASILAPYLAMQAQAYLAFCVGGAGGSGGAPPWCASRLPSLYGFIQREYWDVGLLRFYRDPARLPMVLMSVPVAALSISGTWSYFAADCQRALTLGLYPRGQRLPRGLDAAARALRRWVAAASRRLGPVWGSLRGPAAREHKPGGGRRRQEQQRQQPALRDAVDASLAAAPLMCHWALMTAVALLAMHVNVATRFLSACPPLYWHAAGLLAGGGVRARLLWLWCFSYIVLGCLLFPNFYPWT